MMEIVDANVLIQLVREGNGIVMSAEATLLLVRVCHKVSIPKFRYKM